jgi:hypothetical protein
MAYALRIDLAKTCRCGSKATHAVNDGSVVLGHYCYPCASMALSQLQARDSLRKTQGGAN